MESIRIYDSEFDNLRETELRLGLPGTDEPTRSRKRALHPDTKSSEAEQPVAKAQVVGWPPVRSYRKKTTFHAKRTDNFVKVSMDGAPYLRKIDLKVYKGYKELSDGLQNMFKCFASEYEIAYEDKDGDLMLVGDVPWGMFISSCKRLRIMRGAEARGLDTTP